MEQIKPSMVAIDDEPEFIDTLKSYFLPRGYMIKTASDGSTGLEIIKKEKPDIVLIDMKMRGIDGDEVLMMLKELGISTKVIFITAYDDGGKTRTRLLKSGAYAYFDKPIPSLKILEDAIIRAVNG